MNDELLLEIGRFHAYAQSMKQELDALAAATSDQATGTDSTGAVTVTVGQRNELLEVQVLDKWNQNLQPDQLGEAIVQAARYAEIAKVTESAESVADSGALNRLMNIRPGGFPAAPIEPSLMPVADQRPSPPLDQLIDAALTASEQAGRPPENQNVYVGESETAEGWVTITLSETGSVMDCTVAPYWAADRSGSSISWAVDEAATEARRKLSHVATQKSTTAELDRIISDAIGVLTKLSK
ncbi:hypothetical protein [Nocardia gamkensis]|uniref:YbaB/EbfC DNA-binding family protein n=1 Tax=Nocardia gamkensis TaxID=352869 RepID=A0A7X6L4B5_9NOCA|nr:hypothetical protein [Nocardia gamkensis]NKY27558.1 hypothetical protein [Nocardia gamkensis]NQE71742.1 hypothetical protein [Nocardia gamkensis]